MKRIIILMFALSVFAMPASAEVQIFEIIIKDHKFNPEIIKIPSGEKIKLLIKNQDSTPEEFESYELNREKVIAGNSEGVVFIGPLDVGEYPFFGEFHQKSAQGKIIVANTNSKSIKD